MFKKLRFVLISYVCIQSLSNFVENLYHASYLRKKRKKEKLYNETVVCIAIIIYTEIKKDNIHESAAYQWKFIKNEMFINKLT